MSYLTPEQLQDMDSQNKKNFDEVEEKIARDRANVKHNGREKQHKARKPVWFSQSEIDWLLALLLLHGDDLNLKVRLDRTLRELKDEAERLRDQVKVQNSMGFMTPPEDSLPKSKPIKKPKKTKEERLKERIAQARTPEELQRLLEAVS